MVVVGVLEVGVVGVPAADDDEVADVGVKDAAVVGVVASVIPSSSSSSLLLLSVR